MPLIGPVQTAGKITPIYPIVPIIPPPPTNYLFIERTFIPDEDDNYKIPFYPPVVVNPAVPPFVFQSAFGSDYTTGSTLSLPNNVTIGHILLFAVCDSASETPSPPSTAPGPRWGPGAWTRFDPSQLVYNEIGSGGLAWYWKIADDTSPTGDVGNNPYAAFAIYEIANGDMTGASFIFQTLQASTATMVIGSLPIASNTLTLMLGDWNDTDNGPPFLPPTWSPGPGWTKDFLFWIPDVGGRWHLPIYFASGNATPASGTRGPLSGYGDTPGAWAGIAVVIPAP